MPDMTCTFCSEPIDVRLAYRRISGWERKAVGQSRRSGSDVVLRKAHDEFACPVCIVRAKSGLNVNQEALL